MSLFDQRNQQVDTQFNIVNPLPQAEARTRSDLGILLKNVETTWIKGVLEKSVHEATLLDLGLETRADAIDHPWQMVLEKPDQTWQTLPPEKKIKDIFDEANRLLLILGDPGSGKTTTLLQLARNLIAEVDDTFAQPIPVIFNLSTWANTQEPLDEWLLSELQSKYRAPKKQTRQWLEDRRILPLLDGLDEVKPEKQMTCVEKINQMSVDYGLQMVVCSRIKDYTALAIKLAFNSAIYLQPLSSEQIDQYFDRAGDKLASLQTTLQQDEALQSLAQSPLMLNIMSLAYQDTSAEALNDPSLDTDEARRKHLFDTYIGRMFKRKSMERGYNDAQTKQRLSWLARNMQRHNQEVFLIEGLQPSWLHKRPWRWAYTLVSRLIFGLSVTLFVGLFVELIEWLTGGLTGWLTTLLFFGLIGGLSIGFIDVLRFEWLGEKMKLSTFWQAVIDVVGIGLIFGLFLGLSGGLIDGLFIGLFFGLIGGLRGNQQYWVNDIQTIETLRWSWHKALKGGLILGLIIGLVFGQYENLYAGLIIGLIAGLSGAIFNGLSRGIIETKTTPNQGIRLSAKSAIFGGLVFGLVFGLSGGLYSGLIDGLIAGLIAGLSGAFWYGGFDITRHYTLRFILIIQGHTPHNYAHFLDYTTDLIFLQKVGGSYRFIHRLVLEHFAEMGEVQKNT